MQDVIYCGKNRPSNVNAKDSHQGKSFNAVISEQFFCCRGNFSINWKLEGYFSSANWMKRFYWKACAWLLCYDHNLCSVLGSICTGNRSAGRVHRVERAWIEVE